MQRSTALAIRALIEAAALPKPYLAECEQLLSLRNWSANVAAVGNFRSQGSSVSGPWPAPRSYASWPAEASDEELGPVRSRTPPFQDRNPSASAGRPSGNFQNRGRPGSGGGNSGGGPGGNATGPRSGGPGNFRPRNPSAGPNDRGPGPNRNGQQQFTRSPGPGQASHPNGRPSSPRPSTPWSRGPNNNGPGPQPNWSNNRSGQNAGPYQQQRPQQPNNNRFGPNSNNNQQQQRPQQPNNNRNGQNAGPYQQQQRPQQSDNNRFGQNSNNQQQQQRPQQQPNNNRFGQNTGPYQQQRPQHPRPPQHQQQQQRPQQQQTRSPGSRPPWQQQQQMAPRPPRPSAPRPVPWWERNKVQQEQQAATAALHARQGQRSNMINQRKAPREPEAIVIPHDVTVLRLAHLFGVEVKELEKVLADIGEPPRSEEDAVALDAAELAALELGKLAVVATLPTGSKASKAAKKAAAESAIALPPRPAVVTVMGHVDHGKTTLLDALRSTSVAAREAGGITQHVGAFEVCMPGSGQSLTFLDTPGHAAFSAMRARGAAVTDLVVLVVAADDGVMPQTKEALAHAQAAGCPIVVAITKCDMPAADPEKVKRQLVGAGLLLEGFGGTVQAIEVAAPTKQGLPELEEALLLEGEMMELTADPELPATGTVIEARLDRGQGPLATVIVTRGTLKVGQPIVVGSEWGKVRALRTPGGEAVGKEGVSPGRPVEVVGLKSLPLAGDEMMAVVSEERAQRVSKARTDRSEVHRRAALGHIQPPIAAVGPNGEEQRIMPVVIKADVQGSAEAVRDALANLSCREVRVQVIHAGVGPVTLSDVALAVPSGAKVIGFNVKVAAEAEAEAKHHGVQVLTRRVIYELLGDVGSLVEGLTPRALQEVIVGSANVLATFQVTVRGREKRAIAGCRVEEGIMRSGMKVKVLRNGEVIAQGACDSLRRHKLDVETVGNGTECGLGVEGFDDFQQGDVLQCVDEK